jgi:hypothetical protein
MDERNTSTETLDDILPFYKKDPKAIFLTCPVSNFSFNCVLLIA